MREGLEGRGTESQLTACVPSPPPGDGLCPCLYLFSFLSLSVDSLSLSLLPEALGVGGGRGGSANSSWMNVQTLDFSSVFLGSAASGTVAPELGWVP